MKKIKYKLKITDLITNVIVYKEFKNLSDLIIFVNKENKIMHNKKFKRAN